MQLHEIDALVAAIVPSIKEYIDDKISQIKTDDRIDDAFTLIDDLQKKVEHDGQYIYSDDFITKVAQSAAALIPTPEKGERGEPGEAGEKGEKGDSGNDGRDAVEIDILPAFDPQKTYPRGTYARKNGGLWRSYTDTDGDHGWECIIDGINNIDVDRDEKTISITINKSSGKTVKKEFVYPVSLFKGVWTEEKTYVVGDIVQFGGSAWHCDREKAGKPGTSDSGWSLFAKRGRDGDRR